MRSSFDSTLPWWIAGPILGREDEGLAEQAIERFEAMELDWHAAQTRAQLGVLSTLAPRCRGKPTP